jgi:hypothetical protein
VLGSRIAYVLEIAILVLAMSALFSPDAPAQEPLQDVVYLEDGSVIRGTIIEQTPGESLRIRTRDGSIFVYRMEEVERITREPAVQASERKEPGTALILALVPGVFSVHGVGQWYNGEIGKGFLFFGAGLVGGSMFLSDASGGESESEANRRAAMGLIIWLGSLTWSSIDAYKSAQRINRERGFALYHGASRLRVGFDRSPMGRVQMGLRTSVGF